MKRLRSHMFRKQPIMRRMVLALMPCVMASVYFFGWRSLIVVLLSSIAAYVTEYVFARRHGEPVSEAVIVSAIIFALIMPPTIPFHLLIFGIVFAIMFGKMVFGGFGFNIFNPAMVGRAFLYVSFPVAMTATWAPAAAGPFGALSMWSTGGLPDAITAATPMALVKAGKALAPPLMDLFLGSIAGTMGVTSVLAILLGGVYVFLTKTANRYIILTMIAVYAIVNALLMIGNVHGSPGVLPALMGGGFLFGAFFMATDPVSAPRTRPAQIVYASIIAVATAVIRTFSVFNGGLMFSILLANMFAPILDHVFKGHAHHAIAGTIEAKEH